MAGDYRCEPLAELAKQLRFAPPARRRRQIDQAEQLYWQIEPERNYPLEYVTYRITGYRPDESVEPATLVGAALRDDLITLADDLAQSLDLAADDFDQPAFTTEQLAEQLNVTPRTIKRYRKQGLFARYAVHPTSRGPRKQAVFLAQSIDRFRAAHGEKLDDAAAFERLTADQRQRIITRARRIASRVDVSPFRVAAHLSRDFDCHSETIRRLLINHDAHDPRFAIFRDYRAPLSERDQRLIARAYRRGVAVRHIRERFGCRADAIYRAVAIQRGKSLATVDLTYVASPTFELPDADQVILGPDLPRVSLAQPDADEQRPLIAAPIDAEAEATLFARYNYLKCRAAAVRDQIDALRPSARLLDEAETLVRRAQRTRWRIERAFEPIVLAVAQRHHGSGKDVSDRSLAALQRIGRRVFHRSINAFDVAKNNRFHTYLSYALTRRFARKPRQVRRHRPPAVLPRRFDPPPADRVVTLRAMLDRLDDRRAVLLARHYGAIDPQGQTTEPQPLRDIAPERRISFTMAQRLARLGYRDLARLALQQSLNVRELLPLRDVPRIQ